MKTGESANAKAKKPVIDLPREEWDFRAGPDPNKESKKGDWTKGFRFHFLPEDECFHCWQYEFTRRSYDAELTLKWREGASDPTDFDSLLEHYWRTDPFGIEGSCLVVEWFYRIWPDWPAKPYLSIPWAVRRDRFRKTWANLPKRMLPPLRLTPLLHVYRYVVGFKTGGEKPDLGMSPRKFRTMVLNDDTWVFTKSRATELPTEIAAFEIDFEETDKRLAARFQKWLTERRKEKHYQRRVAHHNQRDRSELKALGAMRLLDAGRSIMEAMDYTEKHSGRALYVDSADWSRATKKAQEALGHAPEKKRKQRL